MSKKLKFILKVFISILLLTFFIYHSGFRDAWDAVKNFDFKYMIICVGVYLIAQLISSYRWKLLSGLLGIQGSFMDHYKYYLIGMYFNLFLPSTIGGDVGKAYYLANSNELNKLSSSAYSIIADRVVGVIVLFWMAAFALCLPVGKHVHFYMRSFIVISFASTVILLPLMPFIFSKIKLKKEAVVYKVIRELKVFWQHPSEVYKAFFWSAIFHLLIILIHYFVALAMDLKIPMSYYLIVYPIVSIISFIPISFNGVGVREGLYIYFFGQIGIDNATSLVFSIFYFVITVLASLVGGYVYVHSDHKRSIEAMQSCATKNADESFRLQD